VEIRWALRGPLLGGSGALAFFAQYCARFKSNNVRLNPPLQFPSYRAAFAASATASSQKKPPPITMMNDERNQAFDFSKVQVGSGESDIPRTLCDQDCHCENET
jgi:hypothetical protein